MSSSHALVVTVRRIKLRPPGRAPARVLDGYQANTSLARWLGEGWQ